jgi:two-component system, OmpR family, sensor histidine kinase VicK
LTTLSSVDTSSSERTEVFHGVDNVINAELQFFSNSKGRIDTCMNYTRPQLAIEITSIKKALVDAKSRGVHTRYLTEITDDNILYCKELMTIVDELQHLDGIKGNFMVSEKESLAPIVLFEKGKVATQIVYSNVKQIVEHQQYVFDTLWTKGISSYQRIREIEEGIESTNVEIIQNPKRAIKLAYEIVKSAKEEVLRIFSSMNAFNRQVRIGVIDLFNESAKQGVKVRMLIPADQKQIRQMVNEATTLLSPNIDVRNIDKSLQTSIGILVVDRKESLIIETKDDTRDNSYDAAGLSVFSNSKPIALSFASIFESLWKQSQMNEDLKESKYKLEIANEQLKVRDKMQKDFINIAAHELRTPIQPILSLTDIVRRNEKDAEQRELLDIVIRNAKKLKKLSEDILDVRRIGSSSLQLNKEEFNIHDLILHIIQDYKDQITTATTNNEIQLVYDGQKMDTKGNTTIVQADKYRINQVISNLVSNSIKYTKGGGIISITIIKNDNNKAITVSVKDTGTGIDPEIMPRLFTKFTTKSDTGTGLGLFISKSIVEAHGGKIWAENNTNGKGATFYFSLPLSKNKTDDKKEKEGISEL